MGVLFSTVLQTPGTAQHNTTQSHPHRFGDSQRTTPAHNNPQTGVRLPACQCAPHQRCSAAAPHASSYNSTVRHNATASQQQQRLNTSGTNCQLMRKLLVRNCHTPAARLSDATKATQHWLQLTRSGKSPVKSDTCVYHIHCPLFWTLTSPPQHVHALPADLLPHIRG